MRTAYALEGAAFLLLIVAGGILFSRSAHTPASAPMETATTTLLLTSTAFGEEGTIPAKYTCDGEDTNPELHISVYGAAQSIQSFALVMDDPDAPSGNWDHWVVFNIPATTTVIKEGVEPEGVQGKTSFGALGYGGPCPGKGKHHYVFKLYALDTLLDVKEGATKIEVEAAMQGHIVASTTLIGLYERKK